MHAEHREEHSHRAAGQRQERAFGEHLTDEAQSRSAECCPYRNLVPSRCAAHQQQVGHVGARDQKYERDGSREKEQLIAYIRDDQILQGQDLRDEIIRVLARQQLAAGRVDGGESLRAMMDRDLADIKQRMDAQDHLLQALHITQSNHTQRLTRKLDMIISMLGRLTPPAGEPA